MTYEDIVFDYNSRALDDRTWDMISDRERVEFVLRMREKREPVALVEVIDRHEGPYHFHGKELLDSGKHNLFTAPQPCPECHEYYHLSWDGKNIKGDKASIHFVKQALHEAHYVPELQERVKSAEAECEKLKAEVVLTKELAQQSNQDHLNARKNYQGEIIKLKAERDELRLQIDDMKASVEGANCLAQLACRSEAEYKGPAEELAAQVEKMRGFAEDNADVVSKALLKAWQLGQTYWQQADSDYVSQNKKSDETQAKFQTLVDETRSTTLALPDIFTSVLNRHRAELLRQAVDLIIDLGDDSSTLDARTLTAAAKAVANFSLAADMEEKQ